MYFSLSLSITDSSQWSSLPPPLFPPTIHWLLLIVTRCLLRRNCGDLVPSPRRLSARVISHKFCIATPQSGAFQRPRCLCSRLSSDDTRMKSISYSRYEGRYALPCSEWAIPGRWSRFGSSWRVESSYSRSLLEETLSTSESALGINVVGGGGTANNTEMTISPQPPRARSFDFDSRLPSL